MPDKTNIRLSDFILENIELILKDWENFARTIEPPALTMDDKALRNHAEFMLREIAADLTRPQTEAQRLEKSKGSAPRGSHDSAAETHAGSRVLSGYSIAQLVSEYRALRASVLRQWTEHVPSALSVNPEDVMRFNEAIDQALAESVARYAKLVEQSQNMFLAILGHDLRNPLGMIMAGSRLIMQATDVASKYILVATRMFTGAQRMNQLIDDLIDFTRTHLGSGLPIKPGQANVADVCMAVVDELRTYHPERAIEFQVQGDMEATCDADRIAQVFSNVIGNAVTYGAENEAIHVRLHSTPESIVGTVQNQGAPIEPQKIATIFEPLVRLSSPEREKYGRDTSLGIGLFIAREIILAHGGTIRVESSRQSGTIFTIDFPRLPCFGTKGKN